MKFCAKLVMVIPKVTRLRVTSDVVASGRVWSIRKKPINAAAEKMYDSTIEPKSRWEVEIPNNAAIRRA